MSRRAVVSLILGCAFFLAAATEGDACCPKRRRACCPTTGVAYGCATYQICYYEANGQYAGYDTTPDPYVATARIQNWSVYGKYARWGCYYFPCPPN